MTNSDIKRHRLLALVQSESRPVHALRGSNAPQFQLHRGDAEWFFENISCQAACPAHTDVARYIAHLAGGNYEAAHQINLEDNLFPGILGRICARPCEDACRRGKVDDPVAICSLKRGAADFAGERLPGPAPRLYRERVAVVGSGPSGLAATNGLVKAGYEVVVFEAQAVAGGMLRWGIPEFRLPRELVKHEIDDYFAALGVEIRLNTRLGHDISLEELRTQFQAVFLACGTMQPQEAVAGGLAGLDYMKLVNLQPEEARARTGKRVAVIGGGFTAMDCARSALRLGAEEVLVLYRRGPKELVVGDYEVEEVRHEGAVFNYQVAPLSLKETNGQPVGLLMIRTEPGEVDRNGRRRPRLLPGSEFELAVDTVIAATGQKPDLSWLEEPPGPPDPASFATGWPGVFAGGDFTTGARNVISAIADGRKAAFVIGRWLREPAGQWPPVLAVTPLKASFKPVSPGKEMRFHRYRDRVLPLAALEASGKLNWQAEAETALRRPVQPVASWTGQTMYRRLHQSDPYQTIERQPMPVIPLQERKLDTEVERGFDRAHAHQEAQRCLQCQLNIFIDGPVCILCNTCVDVCPTKVIQMVDIAQIKSLDGEANPPDLAQARQWPAGAAMTIDEDMCIRCGECVKWCPTGCLSMQHFEPVPGETAEALPLPPAGIRSLNLVGMAAC